MHMASENRAERNFRRWGRDSISDCIDVMRATPYPIASVSCNSGPTTKRDLARDAWTTDNLPRSRS